MKIRGLLIIAILAAAAAAYTPGLHGDFQFDDDTFIAENPLIRNMDPIGFCSLLKSSPEGGRPLTVLTLALNYALGGLSPLGYHLLNLLGHMLATGVLYVFLVRLFAAGPPGSALPPRNEWQALVAAGIFALHPLQTEAVTYVIQRSEIFSSLFYVLSLFFLIRFHEAGGGRSLGYWLISMLCFVAGLGFKEIVVTMPVLFLLYVLFFGERPRWKKAALGIMPVLACGIIFSVVLVVKLSGSGHASFGIAGVGQPEYLLTQTRVVLTYLRLVLLPVNQNFDYDYPLLRSLGDSEVLFLLAFWAGWVVLAFLSLRVRGEWSSYYRRIGFGCLWFLVVLAPTSSLIPIRDVIGEHRVYLATAGIAVAFVSAFDMALQRIGGPVRIRSSLALTLSVALLCTLAVLTYERDRIWETKFSLWEDAASKSPRKARVHNNLGNCRYLRGEYRLALDEYRTALMLDPENVESYFNMFLVYDKLGQRENARIFLERFGEKRRGKGKR